jgi:D-tyrosyl-tRNA(Tyr) deacylase
LAAVETLTNTPTGVQEARLVAFGGGAYADLQQALEAVGS